MGESVAELGSPIFGLADLTGCIAMYGRSPCTELAVAYDVDGDARIEVTTASRPLGGTDWMMHRLLAATVGRKTSFPWSVQIDETHHMLAIEDGRAQFRRLAASSGHWIAAGGFGKRHVLLTGSPGSAITDCTLVQVAFAFDGYPASAHPATCS